MENRPAVAAGDGLDPADDESLHHDERLPDPLLQAVRADPGEERPETLKAPTTPNPVSATPPAGRTTLEEARRGPLGWLQILGPGLVTGASDDDPSAIGTFSVAGAQFGYGLLWTPLVTTPLAVAVQELCGRIALETGVGLGVALRRKFPAWLVGTAVGALIVANTVTIGADLGAVGASLSLVTGGRVPGVALILPVAILIVAFQFFLTHGTIFRTFKWLSLVLFAYVVTALLGRPNPPLALAASLVPHVQLTVGFLSLLVALLGTTIQPYLFFWQATAEVEEMRAAGLHTEKQRQRVRPQELRSSRVDIVVGMLFSQLIMYCVILTAAAVLNAHGHTNVASAQDAAAALRPLAGPAAFLVFGLGIIGTGFLAVPVMAACAAYALKEFLGLRGSLASKPRYRPTFYGLLACSILVGAALNFTGVNPIQALVVASVLNGIVAAPLLVLIVLLGSDRRHMRERVSGKVSQAFTWAATGLMAAAATCLVAVSVPHP